MQQPSAINANSKTVAVPLIGGSHHFLHIVPVAACLSRMSGMHVVLYVFPGEDRTVLDDVLARLDIGSIEIEELRVPAMLKWLGKVKSEWSRPKVPTLLWWRKHISKADTVLVADMTASILKRFPNCPPMILIPHGVGDRARGFESRIRRFDYVLVGGEKIRLRMINAGVVEPDACIVVGGIKLAAVTKMAKDSHRRLFDNDRPVVLYNAHFDPALSSWSGFATDIIDRLSEDGNFNLIVAPHVRLFRECTAEVRARWENLAVADRIIVDLDSPRLSDMTYTMAADIYLGDVSSQIYEFIYRPRPCVFLNSHDAMWKNNDDYLMWQFGEVVSVIDDLVPALERAQQELPGYFGKQREVGALSFGNPENDAATKAADIIRELLRD